MVGASAEQDRLRAARRRLHFRHGASPLNVSEAEWQTALAAAMFDAAVGICHAKISGDTSYSIHVAAIPNQVGCHLHRNPNRDQVNDGNEVYVVVSGHGVLHFGKAGQDAGAVRVADGEWERLPVQTGDSFIIPAGFAHQLRRHGPGALTVLFACPDAHLKDDRDRTMLPDAPD